MPEEPPPGLSTPSPGAADNTATAGRGSRSWWVYALVSPLLLGPCYWQARVQAGDLSSHIYSSCLAQLIESGRGQGLTIASQTTNILFDLILSGLFRIAGPAAAQRIAVSLAVLLFAWGAFAFGSAAAGRHPWHLLPSIAMLAYGWVYHMGFFNFYMSLGLCFWGLAMVWNGSPRRVLCAVPIFALAYLAHALPVVWGAGLSVYFLVARRVSPRVRLALTVGSFPAMMLAHGILSRNLPATWFWQQIYFVTGLDQVRVFDAQYYVPMLGLLLVWGMLFLRLVHLKGIRPVLAGIPFQFCAMSAAAVFLLPDTVLPPGFHQPLTFIAERMSLAVGICVCALLGTAPPRRFDRYAPIALAVVFFAFLYRDQRTFNLFEDRMQAAVARLAPGDRVISAFRAPALRVNVLTHMIDRVCIGRCYSYANYEPSTGQFRIRADAPNPIVVDTYRQSWALMTGTYVVQSSDLPLYQVDLDAEGQMVVKSLRAGALCETTYWNPLTETIPGP
jgi:hypothetical protein